jgi:hypothetical protein
MSTSEFERLVNLRGLVLDGRSQFSIFGFQSCQARA